MKQLLAALAEAQFAEEQAIYIQGIVTLLEQRAVQPDCAWCLCENGLALGNGSHGICPRHAAQIDLQRQQRRAARLAA